MTEDRLEGSNWHFRSDAPPSFGCNSCFLKAICGGLRVRGAAFDCQRFCCRKKDCQIVCFNSPASYARRLKEIGGFEADGIPRCEPIEFERISGFAPLIHHAYSRSSFLKTDVVALSLYELLDRNGAPKFHSLEEVSQNFRFDPQAKIIVSGVHKDRLIERVWSSEHRPAIVSMLKSIRVGMLTTPNYSVYNNVPRPENLYNIKRILLFAQEFLAAGIPTALHINACTDADYDRYAEYLLNRPEYQAISFEFITGPGYPSRQWWHIRKLIELQNRLHRQFQLVLRGGTKALSALSGAYSNIVVVDSDPLHRALHRQRMILGNDGRVKVVKNHLPEGHPIDELFAQNLATAKLEIAQAWLAGPSLKVSSPPKLRRTRDGYDKSRQLNFLANPAGARPGADTTNVEGVVATPKSQGATNIYEAAKKSAKSSTVPGRLSKS